MKMGTLEQSYPITAKKVEYQSLEEAGAIDFTESEKIMRITKSLQCVWKPNKPFARGDYLA